MNSSVNLVDRHNSILYLFEWEKIFYEEIHVDKISSLFYVIFKNNFYKLK